MCLGEPVRVSACHCLDCQRRSGSAFAAQARWPEERVELSGDFAEWSRTGESGSRATFRFCPHCGGTIAYSSDALPGLVAIPLGTLAGTDLPPPDYSVFEGRKHRWVEVTGDGVAHFD